MLYILYLTIKSLFCYWWFWVSFSVLWTLLLISLGALWGFCLVLLLFFFCCRQFFKLFFIISFIVRTGIFNTKKNRRYILKRLAQQSERFNVSKKSYRWVFWHLTRNCLPVYAELHAKSAYLSCNWTPCLTHNVHPRNKLTFIGRKLADLKICHTHGEISFDCSCQFSGI